MILDPTGDDYRRPMIGKLQKKLPIVTEDPVELSSRVACLEGLRTSKDGFDRTNEVYTIQRLYTH